MSFPGFRNFLGSDLIGNLENEINASQRVSNRVSYKHTRNALYVRFTLKRENCHVLRSRHCKCDPSHSLMSVLIQLCSVNCSILIKRMSLCVTC